MSRTLAAALAVLGLFTVFAQTGAMAADKVALVVGNNRYAHAPRLFNPSRDAKAIAQVLNSIGFEVIERYDLDKAGMDSAMEDFARKARDARVGMVYFAGHGIQIQGNAYLVPVDVSLEDDRDVRRLVAADYLLQDASQASELGVVILDACRDNPFLKRVAEAAGATRSMVAGRGLARITDVPKNTLIAYATQSGNVALDGSGDNSPYAQALIKHLPAPGKDVRLVFGAVRDEVIAATKHQQEPYTYGSLGGGAIIINQGAPGQAAVAAPAGKPSGAGGVSVAAVPLPDQRPQQSGAITNAFAEWRAAIDGNDWVIMNALAGQENLLGLLAGELARLSRSGSGSGSVARAIAELSKRPLDVAALGGEWPYQIQDQLCDLNYYGDALDIKFTPKSRTAFNTFIRDELRGGTLTYGALIRLAELGELRPAQSPLSGLWKGEYRYKKTQSAPPVSFEMDLTFSQGRISGFITEPRTFGEPVSANLYASFEGFVVGDTVQWTKTYDGTAGVRHSVQYAGTLDRKAQRITGNWNIGSNNTGPFEISLK